MQHALDLSVSSTTPLTGDLLLPGDKSLSHRAALFAALAEGTSTIDRFLVSGVTRAMLNALTALGIVWRLDGTRLTVHGKGLRGFTPPTGPIFCGNSATTIRMLAGALAASGTPCTLDGSDGLRKRPMNRITDPLRAMGVRVTTPNGCAPLTLDTRSADAPLRATDCTLPVASAQVKSCLILAALAADGVTTLREPGPSRDHTERMLAAMGADIRTDEPLAVRVTPLARPLAPLNLGLPGDISSAAFLLVAAALVPGADEVIVAEILYALRHESARKLEDVVLRRTDLGTKGQPSAAALAACADLMARELGWDTARRAREIAATEARFQFVD